MPTRFPLLTLLSVACAVIAEAAEPQFPLALSAQRPHLLDQRTAPFLYRVDTPWMIMSKHTEADARHYIVRRKEQGFNKAWNKNQPDVYEVSHTEFAKSRARLFFLGESTYEGEHGDWGNALQAREQAYGCLLGGGFGHAYGSPNWKMPANWREILELPGANRRKHLRALLESRPWWKLVPDVRNAIAVEGRGAFATNDAAVTARADDGSFALSYLPTKRRITIDWGQLKRDRARAAWFNPRTGETTRTGTLDERLQHPFDPATEGDWVLGLDDARKPGDQPIRSHLPANRS